MKIKKFWKWTNRITNFSGEELTERTLYLNGTIADESWFDDDVTPQIFKDELVSGSGNITVWINSPGGDCVAAAQIYNMLKDYNGNVTVKIDGIAASAASVIAMAGDTVYMSPVSMLMIHNPSTVAMGDSKDMAKAIAMLDEVKESIINAYENKTGLSRAKLSHLMDDETWMNAHSAVDLGFADDILYRNTDEDENEEDEETVVETEEDEDEEDDTKNQSDEEDDEDEESTDTDEDDEEDEDDKKSTNSMLFSQRAFNKKLTDKIKKSRKTGRSFDELMERLNLIN